MFAYSLARSCLCVMAVACALVVSLAASPLVHAADDRTVAKTKDRYALVVGNSQYAAQKPLVNPRNDAEDMAARLRSIGFEVTVRYDLDNNGLRTAVKEFGESIQNRGSHGIALFYYAGHGMQYQGENYLIPVDATLRSATSIRSETLSLDDVLFAMDSNHGQHGGNIVILDACRNNPFLGTSRGNDSGLALVAGGDNTVIAYATNAGKTADDNIQGRNGLYTGELLQHLGTPNLSISDIFTRTRKGVLAKSKGKQDPRELTSLLENPILFRDPAQTSIPPPVALSVLPVSPAASPTVPPTAPPTVFTVGSVEWVSIPSGRLTKTEATEETADTAGDDGTDDSQQEDTTADTTADTTEHIASFKLMKTEVTVDMYKKCVDEGECGDPTKGVGCNWGVSGHGNHPMNCVDRQQAMQYCKYVGGRLPSASEFEYALRGGKEGYTYSWGNAASKACEYANVADQSAQKKYAKLIAFDCDDGYADTAPVGSFKANGYGLYDMAGNVREQTTSKTARGTETHGGSAWDSAPPTKAVGAWDTSERLKRAAQSKTTTKGSSKTQGSAGNTGNTGNTLDTSGRLKRAAAEIAAPLAPRTGFRCAQE